ncbi:MAG: 30S ribosomal protein S9, partial [Deinococcus sp.]|nr:30S ribosomal protein S9 [Deinococcus sp.]
MAEFYYGTGRRKTAVARVYLRPGEGKLLVNGHDFHEYFRGLFRANTALAPLEVTGTQGRFDLDAKVKGGGPNGQIDAIKLGVARALLELNPDFRPELRKRG